MGEKIIKPEGKRAVGIPKRRWDGNVKMCFKEIGHV
jgi:hypothetical protein